MRSRVLLMVVAMLAVALLVASAGPAFAWPLGGGGFSSSCAVAGEDVGACASSFDFFTNLWFWFSHPWSWLFFR